MLISFFLIFSFYQFSVRAVARSKMWGGQLGRASKGGLEVEPPAGSTSPWLGGQAPLSGKLAGSASSPGTPFGKSGVKMSTPVHPVATTRFLFDYMRYVEPATRHWSN